jgi:hypothetical protein
MSRRSVNAGKWASHEPKKRSVAAVVHSSTVHELDKTGVEGLNGLVGQLLSQ